MFPTCKRKIVYADKVSKGFLLGNTMIIIIRLFIDIIESIIQ